MKNDCIYRQDAVSEIHKYFCEEIDKTSHGTDEDGEDVYTDMPTVNSLLAYNKQLSKRIKALQPAQPEPHWISCEEQLPEEGHDVLITKESFKIKGYEQKVIKAKRSADPRSGEIKWWSPEFGILTNKAVLAWMPLPKPYKGVEE